jgi:hypothetical protein
MFYEYNIEIPKNTPIGSDVIEILRLTRGTITRIDLLFPAGCAGLVGVRLFRAGYQVMPNNFKGYIETDNEMVSTTSPIDLSVNPFELEFYGYNQDDTWNHTIRVRVQVEKLEKRFSMEGFSVESDRLMKGL